MFTANTMSSAIEAMGMSLSYSACSPAVSSEKMQECLKIGPVIKNLLENDIKPLDIITRESLINAITIGTFLSKSNQIKFINR